MTKEKPTTTTRRFVPEANEASLVDDAPGWDCLVSSESKEGEGSNKGPVCWKCRGSKIVRLKKAKKKRAKNNGSPTTAAAPKDTPQLVARQCPVCEGKGFLGPKKQPEDEPIVGIITRGRKRPSGWEPCGPDSHATKVDAHTRELLRKANEDRVDVAVDVGTSQARRYLPQKGEELCNLVGKWRILQRPKSHRWTTDDLVTAWVAKSTDAAKIPHVRYLDLGTGNASVLMMTVWSILRDGRYVTAKGVEARSEAVALARRSVEFNIGPESENNVEIVHSDFRSFETDEKFHLITGTPPYFRVDFEMNGSVVGKAIINQGGMPTAKQSAPARCEFRGGIEAYAEAAVRLLDPEHGRFVVCENWLNHGRVLLAACKSRLEITTRIDVKGRAGRPNLFAVYVMRLNRDCEDETKVQANADPETLSLTVRDLDGRWTADYLHNVLDSMSIPVFQEVLDRRAGP